MQHHGYQTMWIPWNDKLQVVIYKQFLSTGITWFQSLWFLVKITLWSNPHHCSQRFLLQMMLFLLLHLCAINKNAVCPIYIQTTLLHTNNFFLPREISEEILIGDNRCSSITKGSIYHIKYMFIQPVYHGSGLTWNWTFNGSIYYVWYYRFCTYCVFTLYGSDS